MDDVVPLPSGRILVASSAELDLLGRELVGPVKRPLHRRRLRAPVPFKASDGIGFVKEVLYRQASQLEVPPPFRLALAVVVAQQMRKQPALSFVGGVIV